MAVIDNAPGWKIDASGNLVAPRGRYLSNVSGLAVPIEAFGAVGDGVKSPLDSTGTNDAPAFNAALTWAKSGGPGRRIYCDPSKVYMFDGPISADLSQGVQLWCDSGLSFQDTAWLKFRGAINGPLISARSALGFCLNGFQIDTHLVTEGASDFGYANKAQMLSDTSHVAADVGKIAKVSTTDFIYPDVASRKSAVLAASDVGKTALQQDNGSTWKLIDVADDGPQWAHCSMRWKLGTPGASPVWWPFETDIIDLGQTNWRGYEGPQGGASSNARITNCSLGGTTGIHTVAAGIRLHSGFNHTIDTCVFANLYVGVSGLDSNWGGNFSHAHAVRNCTGQNCDDAVIYGIGNSWTIEGCTIEPCSDGSAAKIWCPSFGALSYSMRFSGNFWSDGSGAGACMRLNDLAAASVDNNYLIGNVRLKNCDSLSSRGNTLLTAGGPAYVFESGGAPSKHCELGRDYYTGPAYVAGTNYTDLAIR